MQSKPKKALFLDRDGTINVDYGYVYQKERFDFIDGVFELCRKARQLGYLIVIATNQSGIERGYFTEADFEALTAWTLERFRDEGVEIAAVFHCPTLSGDDRKPKPGMFLKAKALLNLDMSASVSLGDKERDVEAGVAAGVGKNLLFAPTPSEKDASFENKNKAPENKNVENNGAFENNQKSCEKEIEKPKTAATAVVGSMKEAEEWL
ncbi:MAG: HAD family hydrolase [Thermoguttaceae bacterium]|nr:HAD family hydrolase [Thermoguttaceae bacterium]MBQ8284894.1 HAD family hydrolase [Thermoguttaceae bacterium]